MELVRFYACAGDPVVAAARLARKAYEQGEPICVCGSKEDLERLSGMLWQTEGFIAHANANAGHDERRFSRLELRTMPPDQAVPLLLNLRGVLSPESTRAKRLFDVFGSADDERAAARQRFRWHQRNGVQPATVQVAGP